jgi:8-oxo-dGTP pyrophosphatase MutT (NUDIX family)
VTVKKDNPWQSVSSEVVHKNQWFYVRQDKVITPEGKDGEYNVVVSPGAAFIVALNENNKIYLIGQYRYPTGVYSLELPAGSIDDQEPLVAAKRELQEETGLVAKEWKQLGVFQSANGIMSELCYVFMATNLEQTNHNAQIEEGIDELIPVSLEEALKMIKNGELSDGQSIASLTMAAIELDYFHKPKN